jgi:thiazole synthase ThiGH ThiG subunit
LGNFLRNKNGSSCVKVIKCYFLNLGNELLYARLFLGKVAWTSSRSCIEQMLQKNPCSIPTLAMREIEKRGKGSNGNNQLNSKARPFCK